MSATEQIENADAKARIVAVVFAMILLAGAMLFSLRREVGSSTSPAPFPPTLPGVTPPAAPSDPVVVPTGSFIIKDDRFCGGPFPAWSS